MVSVTVLVFAGSCTTLLLKKGRAVIRSINKIKVTPEKNYLSFSDSPFIDFELNWNFIMDIGGLEEGVGVND